MAFYNELERWKTNQAFIDDLGNSMTYQELERYTSELKTVIGNRTLVFSFSNNTIGSVTGYIAFLKNRVVPLLLKVDIEKELRDNLIKIYQPSYLYIPENKKDEFPDYQCVWEGIGYCLLQTQYPKEVPLYQNLALLLTTSGSTGSPKLVRQSYDNIQSNAQSIAQYLELNETERPITTLPMNYTYGLSIINSHLFVGATILLTEYTLMEREFWDFFKQEKATSFGGVPYTYEILKKLRFFKMDLPYLRTMTQAGGKLSPELHREFAKYAQENGKHFVVMYGQTEATARMGYLPWKKAIEKYGSMGIAIPGGKLWLKDIQGNKIIQPDIIGELVYEGKNVTLGYAICKEDLKKEDERYGVLETGDMAKMDEEGYFYIVGRKKRFLKIFGNRVNLDETERMIKVTFEGLDCACAGIDDKLYIFITEDSKEKREEVKHFLSLKTGINISAFIVKTITEIPKNEAGKTQYRKLEEFYD
ncbi:MAG: AMP-binding protein [Lachnospiraceae bacterium]|jgi:long-chain acyl-CoA synthetase|nr:AMP-binding protein [Lachnospiraceae bacterium]